MGYTIEDGYLVLGKMEIGKECKEEPTQCSAPGTKMGDGSILLEQSMLSEGVKIPSGETWSGAPASVSEPDNDILAMRSFHLKSSSLKKKADIWTGSPG